jgi:hypothetical protein
MKVNVKIVALAMLVAIGAGVSCAKAQTPVHFNLEYIGSTTGNASSSLRVAQNSGNGAVFTSVYAPGGDLTLIKGGLTQMDLTNSSIQATANLKNYFALYVDYWPNADTDRLCGVGFDITFPTGMAPVTGNNISDDTTNKFLFWNPTDGNSHNPTWDVFRDYGSLGGDLQDIRMRQTHAANAYAMAVGTLDNLVNNDDSGYIIGKGTLLGLFALKFTQTDVNMWDPIVVVRNPENICWYTANNDSAIVYEAPEPASLGALALGSLALLTRRRRR